MNRFYSSALLIGIATLGSAWLVRPDGSGDIERTQAMTALNLNEANASDVATYKALVQNQQINVHLVRNATYDVPCTNDGGTTTKWFQRSQAVDADLVYKYNGITKGVKILGYGAGTVTNNVKCPGGFVRAPGGDDFMPAVMVAGTATITVDSAPINEPMRLP